MPRKNNYPVDRVTRQVLDECIDCHSEFERSSQASQKVRCDLCQQERNRINISLRVARARHRKTKAPPVKTDGWNCAPGKCVHFDACKAAIRADRGAPLACMPEAIEVPTLDVTSEFRAIDMGAKVWRNYGG